MFRPELFYVYVVGHNKERRVIGISGSLIWSKTLMELMFNPYGEFRWSPEGSVSQIHYPDLQVGAPRTFSDLLRSVQMLKRERDMESNGKLPHLFIPSKTAALVPEFAVEELPLGRTAALEPEFPVKKDLPLDRTLWWWYQLPHLFIPSKTATLVPEFTVEDLPLGRTAALVPEFAVKELFLSRTLWSIIIMKI